MKTSLYLLFRTAVLTLVASTASCCLFAPDPKPLPGPPEGTEVLVLDTLDISGDKWAALLSIGTGESVTLDAYAQAGFTLENSRVQRQTIVSKALIKEIFEHRDLYVVEIHKGEFRVRTKSAVAVELETHKSWLLEHEWHLALLGTLEQIKASCRAVTEFGENIRVALTLPGARVQQNGELMHKMFCRAWPALRADLEELLEAVAEQGAPMPKQGLADISGAVAKVEELLDWNRIKSRPAKGLVRLAQLMATVAAHSANVAAMAIDEEHRRRLDKLGIRG